MDALPSHLKKYIVEQDYEKYTPVDHATWRYILRQLRAFLSKNAHECYLEGLEKTGISTERIPRISEISEKLSAFGWRALPVSGFIPPAAFMELQSLGVLPIASDMRTLDHLLYTPAPDIVHEAAGHAPILIHPEFSEYLKQYAQVARKAIISKEDLDLYEAIRILSDLKEDPRSSALQIQEAQEKLDQVGKNISHVSEAAQLGRMNWWTAEYGLIGSLEHPRIFGAGLLSSVGESKWCLSNKVQKIPLSVNCIEQSYDITEPQPQLFVTPDFKTLREVLEQFANRMAFRTGGLEGLEKAIQAQTVNSVELNSGLQISGQVIEVIGNNPDYIRFTGPSQICYQDRELPGHDRHYHAHGFGTAVGTWKKHPKKNPSEMTDEELKAMGIVEDAVTVLEYSSGVVIEGKLISKVRRDQKLVLLAFQNCTVRMGSRILFEPAWGTFDLAIGSKVTSVFGGPADRKAFGETDDFVAKRVTPQSWDAKARLLHDHYSQIRMMREKNNSNFAELNQLIEKHSQEFPNDWLLHLEALELTHRGHQAPDVEAVARNAQTQLSRIAQLKSELKPIIDEGVALAHIQ